MDEAFRLAIGSDNEELIAAVSCQKGPLGDNLGKKLGDGF